ncbi:MAG: tripartite tricarboxylate transporter substrate binding protein [Betaproteobacteria bacterium]|jgi:tripartite-type tricarboxylate transporter receptor subunit TctC|nr:tripartite tricarboxylate transporter substrate binding protein [Betaproteobacteria bacterium]MDH4293206.1 tripartite tricarboxylate transporter substrate binding protein [Betaproteobacteria bacterium]MDH5341722.1 tripartite tricarboxylate transporter substrate binding protein [Betaproteobacteria bacterium]
MRHFVSVILSLFAFALAGNAIAQNYPSRPIRLIVPFPPGGNVDVFARVLYREVESIIGTNFVIDNRGGANGLIGADAVKNANADGYTLLNTSFAFAVNPAIRKSMPFDIVRDFTPVTNVATGLGYLVVVNPKLPVKNIAELIELAKKQSLSYSTAGVGNGQHLAGSLLTHMAKIKMLHVPYKGGGPAAAAVVGGEVQIHFPAGSVGVPHHKAGRVRAIAFTGAKRLSSMPEIPTVGETVKGYVSDAGWHAVFGPAKMPMPIARKVQQAIHKALQNPKVNAHFVDNGYEPNGDTPEVWAKLFRADVKRFAQLAKDAGIEPQ